MERREFFSTTVGGLAAAGAAVGQVNQPQPAPPAQPTPCVSSNDIDLFRNKVRDFTDIENLTLEVWIQLLSVGRGRDAQEVLDAGLTLEHTISLLDADPSKRTPQQVAETDRLRQKFFNLVGKGQAIYRSLVARGRGGQGIQYLDDNVDLRARWEEAFNRWEQQFGRLR